MEKALFLTLLITYHPLLVTFSFKHIYPFQEFAHAGIAELLKALCSLNNGPFQLQMRLRIKLVGIAYHLFLQHLRLIMAVEWQRQVLTLYLLVGKACAGMPFTDHRMSYPAFLTQHLPADETMPDIRLRTEALDAGSIAPQNSYVVQHRRLFQKFRVEPQLWMSLGNLQTTVGHLATMY